MPKPNRGPGAVWSPADRTFTLSNGRIRQDSPDILRPRAVRGVIRLGSFIVLIALSVGVAGYAVGVYGYLPLGAAVHPSMRATFEAHHRSLIYSHVFASACALVLGPFQFWARLRSTRPALHRWSGRIYLGVGVLVGGLAGVLVALNAFGGLVARLGFASLAVAWLFSGFMAYRAIRAHDVASHRQWMVRNFALTFAAVTLRLWLSGLVVSGLPFEVAYPIIAWLCWVPNLVVAESLFNKTHARGAQPAPPSGRIV